MEETIESFELLVGGELDDLPEQAFFNVGNAESAREKAKTLGDQAGNDGSEGDGSEGSGSQGS